MPYDYQEESEDAGVGDLRSTGRKWARKTYLSHLADENGVYACEKCGRGPEKLPYTMLSLPYGDPTWAVKIRLPDPANQVANLALQVNHRNKNLSDVDLANLELLCPRCHKLEDSKTEKRKSAEPDVFGYCTELFAKLLWPDERDINWEGADEPLKELLDSIE